MIGGDRVAAAEGASFDVTNPATGTRLASVAAAGSEDVDRAVAAAAAAYEVWGALSPVTRGRHMHRFAALVEEHAEELALLECRNVGMPIGDARGQLGMIVDVIRYYAGAVDKFFGHTIPVERDGVAHDVPRADRRRRPDHALELPAQHRQLEDRPRARRRQHGGAEARVADAALGAALRRAGRRGGHPGRGAERRPRAGRDGRERAGRASRRRQDRLHRVDRGGRRASPARAAATDEAGDARAGRQVGLRRLRRRRPGEGRGGWRRTRCSRTAARTAAPARA